MTLTRRHALALAAAAPFAALARPAAAATYQVVIQGFQFSPANFVVNAGDRVIFVNQDNAPHTATANDGSFDTGQIGPGGKVELGFDTPGRFEFFCRVHPHMKGSVEVK